ncbi:tripartite tricarboxylate transporter substrate-binding protein [Cupriavidus sp. TMH.W2]|uniref:tripartite tricarboxylate transporter substrate-binding protein n=1 Tax=Cupriavidus sp. TMH.W2 TaxID=3434465 RepID=UPI003D789A37
MKRVAKMVAAALAVSAMAVAAGAYAQDYPGGKPVSAVVPFAAGGPTDKVARELTAIMSKHLGTTIVIENLGGAGGTIGAKKVAQSKNDGYTILIHHIGMATAPALYRNLGFDPLKDFEMVGEIADVPMILVGNKQLPPNNFKDLLPYIKANASKLSLANAGIGSASHLCGLLFQSAIQTELTTVPYKGAAPALTDILGGQVNLLCDQTTNLAGHLKASSVKSYAAMQARRVEAFKDVPTAAEQGMPGVEVKVWHAMYAPKGTPKPVIDKLSAALQKAVADPTFRAKMAELGAEAVPAQRATPDSLRTYLSAEINKWTPVIKKAGVYAD